MRFGKSLINFGSAKHTALGKVQPVFILYGFRQRKICADLRCLLVFAGLIELHCKSSRNVLSSSRKYTREILHSSRERDFYEQDSMLVPY